MARETKVTAMTKIDELLSKRGQIHERTASIISDVMVTRVKESSTPTKQQTITELSDLISHFSKEEQVEILKHVIADIAANLEPNNKSKSKGDGYAPFRGGDRSSLFR